MDQHQIKKISKYKEKEALKILNIEECPVCKSKGIEVYDFKEYVSDDRYQYNLRCKVCKKFFGRYNDLDRKIY